MSEAKQLGMIKDCISFIQKTENLNVEQAFKKVLGWCAYKVGVPGVVSKGKASTHTALEEMFDLELLKKEQWDWFGEVYEQLQLNKKGVNLSSKVESMQMAAGFSNSRYVVKEQGTFTRSIMDTNAGTGRGVLALDNILNGEYVYYGMEQDKLIYRICITNMFMYKVPAKIMCADHRITKADASSTNWDMANNWYPVAQNKLESVI